MRTRLVRLLTVLTFVLGLLVAGAAPAHASGYYQDGYSSQCNPNVYSTWSGGYISVCFDVTGYYDGSHRYYRVSTWDTDGSSLTGDLTVRYWVCGTYYGSVHSVGSNGNWYALYSGTYTYGGCGHQADNYYSEARSNYWGTQSIYVSI